MVSLTFKTATQIRERTLGTRSIATLQEKIVLKPTNQIFVTAFTFFFTQVKQNANAVDGNGF